jgi:hypothetical protein
MWDALFEIRSTLQFSYLLLTVAAAYRWGAGPERACATSLLFLAVIDWPYHWLVGRGAILSTIDVGHLIMDLVTWSLLYATAMKANRIYTLWIAAFQLIMVLSHFARGSVAIAPLAYAIMNFAPSYAQIMTLCLGIHSHHKRAKQYGSYRSWRTS